MSANFNETAWSKSFQDHFHLIEDKVAEIGQNLNHWRTYKCRLFGKFNCSRCHRSWSSTECLVELQYRYNMGTRTGEVSVKKEYGQNCKRHPEAGFVHPTFQAKETDWAVTKLLNKIMDRVYGIENYFELGSSSVHRERRQNHDSANCEACRDGVCGNIIFVHGLPRPRGTTPHFASAGLPRRERRKIRWIFVRANEVNSRRPAVPISPVTIPDRRYATATAGTNLGPQTQLCWNNRVGVHGHSTRNEQNHNVGIVNYYYRITTQQQREDTFKYFTAAAAIVAAATFMYRCFRKFR